MRARLLVVALLVLTSCGGSDDEPTVFAAASLTDALTEIGGASFSFAGSTALATQLREGAPADVIATADERTMDGLVADGLVDDPVVFATNTMAVVVEEGNPEGITTLGDLSRDDLVVVLVEPAVPAGAYAQQVLDAAGVAVRAASLELDVRAAVAKVAGGEADATIAYASDLETQPVGGFVPPAEHNVVARYPIAVVRDGDRRTARDFIDEVLTERGQAALRRHGFLPAP